MDKGKFAQITKEFPFLAEIFAEQSLSAEQVGWINVKRADRNLLAVTPSMWAHDAGEYGNHEGYRSFWCVSSAGATDFTSSWHRSITPHGIRAGETATSIGIQLHYLGLDVQYIVEVSMERWDGEDALPHVTIYKMKGFDWPSLVRHLALPVS